MTSINDAFLFYVHGFWALSAGSCCGHDTRSIVGGWKRELKEIMAGWANDSRLSGVAQDGLEWRDIFETACPDGDFTWVVLYVPARNFTDTREGACRKGFRRA